MHDSWISAFAFILVAAALSCGLLLGARLLRVRALSASPLKRRTYECGEEPEGPAWIRFHPRYYVVALLFVLFEVEAAFLFPWATAQDALGVLGLFSMFLFIAVLLLGWWYAVRKGAIKWQ
ncbi:MAG TPA: NADH-quinone oxidoreductase subunit A [Polyangiaceae bacterium]